MFVAEGIKTVQELLASDYKAHDIYTTDVNLFKTSAVRIHQISQGELRKISGLKSPNTVLGVFHIPINRKIDFKNWIIALDGIQDPGNLGTIIRLCDWFGIGHLLCSVDSVDCYNPKVLQATMGSIARVNVVYTNLNAILQESTVPAYGAYMEGEIVYAIQWPKAGILVMGNEANGISGQIGSQIEKKIGIPQFGAKTAESLNVATATAILLNEIRRGDL